MQFSPTLAPHRFAQIDFHIGCRQWVENHSNAELLFTHMDFDVEGSKRHGTFTSRTELRVPNSNVPIVPDGMFGVELNGSPIIYALEIHRTTETKRVIAQIKRYMEVLETGVAAAKYDVATSPLICSVHMKDNVLRGVKSALQKHRALNLSQSLNDTVG